MSKSGQRKLLLNNACNRSVSVNFLLDLEKQTGLSITLDTDISWKIYPQFNFFTCSSTDKNLSAIGTFDCIALVGTLLYVMYDLDQIFDSVRKMLKTGGVFAINQTFLLDQQYGNDVFEGLHGFLDLLSKNLFFNISKIISNRILYEGRFVMDTAILLETIC